MIHRVSKSALYENNEDLASIIQGCLRENPHDQRKLYDLLAGMIMGVAIRYDVRQADDIFQEAILKIFKSLHKVDNVETFFGWAKKITINTAIDHLKTIAKQNYDTNVELSQAIVGSDAEVFGHISNEELLEMIASLPQGYRLIFNLYEVEGYTHKEIAVRLGISEGTSKSQLYKAKLALREMLKKNSYILVNQVFVLFYFLT